jgi:hypothetical protein
MVCVLAVGVAVATNHKLERQRVFPALLPLYVQFTAWHAPCRMHVAHVKPTK